MISIIAWILTRNLKIPWKACQDRIESFTRVTTVKSTFMIARRYFASTATSQDNYRHSPHPLIHLICLWHPVLSQWCDASTVCKRSAIQPLNLPLPATLSPARVLSTLQLPVHFSLPASCFANLSSSLKLRSHMSPPSGLDAIL